MGAEYSRGGGQQGQMFTDIQLLALRNWGKLEFGDANLFNKTTRRISACTSTIRWFHPPEKQINNTKIECKT